MGSPKSAALLWPIIALAFVTTAHPEERPETLPHERLDEVAKDGAGFCLVLGSGPGVLEKLADNSRLLIHCLEPDPRQVDQLRQWLDRSSPAATVLLEHWRERDLPHADNLANYIVQSGRPFIDESEIRRALLPGGSAIRLDRGTAHPFTKPFPDDTDEWTHQWHSAGGALVTDDRQIDVPQGVQWLSGPLFAMSGRKSSTQSLVSAGGINFYVTQNVLDNVGDTDMTQFLVARDAYNGLLRWQRPWTGPFVTGDGETNPRMVATADTLYTAGDDKLVAIRAKTGRTVAETRLDESADKLLVQDGIVLSQNRYGVTAYSSDLGQRIWGYDARNPSGLVADDESVYFLIRGRSADGQFRHDLVRLALATGEEVWRVSTQPHVSSASVQVSFARDGLIALNPHGHLHLFSADDGQHLWSRATDAVPGKGYVDERYVGHFYRRGLVWLLEQNSKRDFDGQNRWVGLDPRTGESRRELTTKGPWPRTATPAKMGCQLLVASDRFIIIPRQSTYVDFETGEKTSFKFVRGGCGLGFVPANGLLYSHPHACGCFSEAIRGFIGMHSQGQDELSGVAGDRLRRSPGVAAAGQPASPHEPAIYRANPRRGGAVDGPGGGVIESKWSRPLAAPSESISDRGWRLRTGNRLTAPTISGDAGFIADVDRGRLTSLSLSDGESEWTFTANGRINSPPTIYRGICLFGSHDGYVYGLNASSGELMWKFRAAPIDRRIVAFGNLESAWPVAGSVLIHDDMAYVAAGRAPDADGGIEVHALEPHTGVAAWSTRVDGQSLRGLCDYLVAGDEKIFLNNWGFDPDTGAGGPVPGDSPHLQGGKVGLLEASWTKHDLANRKEMQTWTAAGISGQLLAFSDQVQVAYQAGSRLITIRGPGMTVRHQLQAPEQVTAMLLTDTHLLIGGGKDRADREAGGFLRSLDLADGKVVSNIDLSAEVVFDGIAWGQGHLLVPTQDGRLHCFRCE